MGPLEVAAVGPVRVAVVNYLRQPLTSSESVTNASGGTDTRTSAKTYDTAGRVVTESVAGSIGLAVKTTKHVYSSTTGRETATQSLNSDGSVHSQVTRSFDTLGRQTGYTDAEGHVSTTSYDLLSRVATRYDGKATRTNTYDAITGDLSNVYDPAAGNFSASYDEGGRVAAVSMPGNITKSYEYDETGAANYSQYVKTSGCTDDCLLYWSWMMENIHGQTVGLWGSLQNDAKESSQTFTYDKAGRLIRTDDWRDDGADWTCDTREYDLDADSNRTKLTKYAPAGDCGQGATTTKNNSYDAADRLTNAGYTYDSFGRITTVPATDAGSSGDMTATYYVNDLARSITADGTTQTLALDPVGRMRNKLKTGAQSATESYAYTDDSDSPAWTSSGSTWTRYIDGPTGDVGAIQQSSGAVSLAISNLRGDIVAELTNGQLQAVREVDEFGVVKDGMPEGRKYGFHGTKQREALTAGGTIAMGVRLYVPQTGRFLQVDPVVGGTEAPYVYPSDPVNGSDLDGRSKKGGFRFTTYLNKKAAKRLIRLLKRRQRREELTGQIDLALGASGGALAGLTVAGAGLAAASMGAGIAGYAQRQHNANKLADLIGLLEDLLEESHGRGVNVVMQSKTGELSDITVSYYARGKKDPKCGYRTRDGEGNASGFFPQNCV